MNEQIIEKKINNLPPIYLDLDLDTNNNLNNCTTIIPYEFYKESFFSLVSETDFSNGNIQRITEKTLKSFAMGHPSIIVGNPYSLDLVKELGFELFEDIINPEYDKINDPIERFKVILETFEKTINYVNEKPKLFAESMYERSKYNFLHSTIALKKRYEELIEYPIIEYIIKWLSKEN
jgi:hypothetical protein